MISRTTVTIALLIVSLSCSLENIDATLAREESKASEASLSQLKQGEAKGSLTYGNTKVEFKYSHARRVKATYTERGYVYALLISDQPFTEDIKRLKTEDDFRVSARISNSLLLIVNLEGEVLNRKWNLSVQNGTRSESKLYPKGDRPTVNLSEGAIQGELMEKGKIPEEIPVEWNYQVMFKTSIIKE